MRKIREDAAKELRDTRERMVMETPNEGNRESVPAEAEKHIKSAHQMLKTLQQKIGDHPEIGAAITKLEMALNVLAVQTGGLL
jgi:predicted translin family RNA/ssDNA-binding protein